MSEKIIHREGDRVGECLYIRETIGGKHKKALFKCKCGKEFENYLGQVRQSLITSCGCEYKKPGKKLNINSGEVLGACIFLERLPKSRGRFQCRCGNIFESVISHIKSGATISCGCNKRKYKEPKAKSTEYRSWLSMRRRCTQKSYDHYESYGGRGIKVCERWSNSFQNFLDDMGLKPSLKHSLDRIDVNGDYSPENCKWATQKEQSRNTRRNIYVEYKGETKPLSEWCEILNLNYFTTIHRIKNSKWSVEKAFTTPSYLGRNQFSK